MPLKSSEKIGVRKGTEKKSQLQLPSTERQSRSMWTYLRASECRRGWTDFTSYNKQTIWNHLDMLRWFFLKFATPWLAFLSKGAQECCWKWIATTCFPRSWPPSSSKTCHMVDPKKISFSLLQDELIVIHKNTFPRMLKRWHSFKHREVDFQPPSSQAALETRRHKSCFGRTKVLSGSYRKLFAKWIKHSSIVSNFGVNWHGKFASTKKW